MRQKKSKIQNLKSKIALGNDFLCLVACVALFDASRLAAQIAQVIKLRAADFSVADNVYVVNNGRVKRENAFDADTEADLANRDGFAHAAVFAGDHDAFKCLQAFLAAFLDPNVDANVVA